MRRFWRSWAGVWRSVGWSFSLRKSMLAEQAGVSKRTVERIEAGATAQTATLIRILRVLELVDRLETLVPEAGPRPMDLVKLKGKARKRASGKRKAADKGPWQWGDEDVSTTAEVRLWGRTIGAVSLDRRCRGSDV